MKSKWGFKREKGTKFGNQKTRDHAGRTFDSRAEAALFDLLSLRERGGEIRALTHHPSAIFLSASRIQYRPDFRFINCATEETEWAEFKGFETSDWRIKRRLWMSYGPGKLHVYKGVAGRMKLVETLQPKQGESDGAEGGGLGAN